jgi:hypothetical protein
MVKRWIGEKLGSQEASRLKDLLDVRLNSAEVGKLRN